VIAIAELKEIVLPGSPFAAVIAALKLVQAVDEQLPPVPAFVVTVYVEANAAGTRTTASRPAAATTAIRAANRRPPPPADARAPIPIAPYVGLSEKTRGPWDGAGRVRAR
jgi:hypothetical protein